MSPATDRSTALQPGEAVMIEWAEVAPGTVMIATADRAWIHRVSPFDLFAESMAGAGSIETTRMLLDAAIGVFQRPRLDGVAPPLTMDEYVQRVLACYYGGKATPPLMLRAAERFRVAGRHDLESWGRAVAVDEDHDHLALADLVELGYPPEVVDTMPCPAFKAAAIEYFEACVDGDEPVSCMGYVYALERAAALIERSYVEAIEAWLGPGVNATRCLRWHSSVGDEPHHVERLLRAIVSLPASERACVARSAYQASRILFAGVPAAGTDERSTQWQTGPTSSPHGG